MRAHEGSPLAHYAWRLRPVPGSTLYVYCVVFDRVDAMRRYASLTAPLGARLSRRLAACCTTPAARERRVASVVFCRKRLGGGIVSHEMTHAAVSWGVRAGWDWSQLNGAEGVIPKTAPEEMLAEIVGELVRQFFVRAQRVGIY